MNSLFVQFYNTINNRYDLINGFSDTYDLCKTKGDFLWIDENKPYKLPIQKGTVYVSVCYLTQLYIVYQLAIMYPDIKFIVGGPVTNTNYWVGKTLIPKNINIITCTVEEYFGVPNFSYPWKLELPEIEQYDTINYMYTLDNYCYWQKCIYCSFKPIKPNSRTNIDFGFLNVEHTGKQVINLYAPSISPSKLYTLLSKLTYDKNIRYDIFLRADKKIKEVLKKLLIEKGDKFPFCKFFLGIEFPSNRMLKFMKKNNTVEDFLNIIEMLTEFGYGKQIIMHLPFILRWNNLESSDIIQLEQFLSKLDYNKLNFVFSVYPLEILLNTPLHNDYYIDIDEKLYRGPFCYGFKPLISKEQIDLSQQALNLLNNQPVDIYDYTNGFK